MSKRKTVKEVPCMVLKLWLHVEIDSITKESVFFVNSLQIMNLQLSKQFVLVVLNHIYLVKKLYDFLNFNFVEQFVHVLLNQVFLSQVKRVGDHVLENYNDFLVLDVAMKKMRDSLELRYNVFVFVVSNNLRQNVLIYCVFVIEYNEVVFVDKSEEILSDFYVLLYEVIPSQNSCEGFESHLEFLSAFGASVFDQVNQVFLS